MKVNNEIKSNCVKSRKNESIFDFIMKVDV